MALFENNAWGISLKYPADWSAKLGDANAPLVINLLAPGRKDTVGAGVSVVGASSAAPLEDATAAFLQDITGPVPAATPGTVGGCPARFLVYGRAADGGTIVTQTVIVRAPERYFIFTFAAYEPQYETAYPYFGRILKSVVIE